VRRNKSNTKKKKGEPEYIYSEGFTLKFVVPFLLLLLLGLTLTLTLFFFGLTLTQEEEKEEEEE